MSPRSRPAVAFFVLAILVTMSLAPALTAGLDEERTSSRSSSRSTSCSTICINEMLPNPDGSDQGIFPNGEWVELYNFGSTDVSLEGWTLEDVGGWVHPIDQSTWVGFDELSTAFTLGANAYAVIAENEVGTLRLNNAGETLYLKDASGTIVHTITTSGSSMGVSKVPDSTDDTADWLDSQENTPGAQNSGGTGGGDGGGDGGSDEGTTPESMTRIMMFPPNAEVTGMHIDANGNFFVNAMHPDDDNYKATIGVINGIDWNDLPNSVPELASSSSELDIWHGIRTSYGDYQVLLQSGDALSEGGVAGGIYAADDGNRIFSSEKPDYNAFVPLTADGSRGYLYTAWEERPAGISQLEIEWNTVSAEWDVLGGMMLDLSSVNGGWVLCFGSMSPWGTPLLAEELYFSNTRSWNDETYNYHYDQERLEDYLGYYPNPYDYGYIMEIENSATTDPDFIKHFSMGRFSHENAQVMPDERTVYLSDDGYDTVLFKFVADTVGDLSSGTLYAARVTQDDGSDSATTGFDVEWMEMASSSNSVIQTWIDEYDGITTADFIAGQNSYITDEEIRDWAEGRLNDDLNGDGTIGSAADDRVAFLESRKAAAALGASDEWNKMEGIVFNPNAPNHLYLAMSDVRYDMSDGQGDIDVTQNRCGIVYRMTLDDDWNVNRIEPVISGGPYTSSATYECDVNNLAGPDNLAVLDDGRVLIGEDTGKHENNMVWLWEPTIAPEIWDGEYDIQFTRIMPGEVPDRENDWLEITNFGGQDVNLGGWTIDRIRSTTPWISEFGQFILGAGESVVLSENPANLLADGGIVAIDGNSVMNNMPWLVDYGGALQLKEPTGIVVDAIVYGGGDAEIDGWTGPATSVPGDGTPGLILMRGDGCSDGQDTDSAADWQERWIRIGASIFCDGAEFGPHIGMSAKASFSPETGLADLLRWLEEADESLHIQMYEMMSPDLTHALLRALARGVEVTIVLEEGIFDDYYAKQDQLGHAQSLSDAGASVLWMIDPTAISSPYAFIHSKTAVRDGSSTWFSSGNWKDSSFPPTGDSGNREWSLFIDSTPLAASVLERMAWDENENHLHIEAHSSVFSPDAGWTLSPDPATTPTATLTPDTTTPFRMRLLTCPDDCVDGLMTEIEAAESMLRISVQYLDLGWYWGFGEENPILAALHAAAVRGVRIELLLNAYYADSDDDIRDAVNLFNTDWNGTQGLDVNARLMATSPTIWKLHNKGMIIDDDTILVGGMNWGSSSMLRNREMGVIAESSELAAIFGASFDEDWRRLDAFTDSDGDLLPDSWEVEYGLNRHSAAVLGTALSEQSLDPDEDGLDNLNEYLLGGDPLDADTDDDCILDGQEVNFARTVMRAPSAAMVSGDVDGNGVPDGEQFGCDDEPVDPGPGDGGGTNSNNGGSGNGEDEPGSIINVRDDPLATPGAKLLLGLTLIAAISLLGAGLTMIRRPKTKADERLVDDSGYRFDDVDSEMAILKGTRFDEKAADTRELTEGRDDGSHGAIVLDGFGFEELSRDEVQWRLDRGISLEELRDEAEEDEA